MISGKDLHESRASKGHPRNLPSMPPKDFQPTGSEEEAAAIDTMVREKISFLKDERVEKKNLISAAEWLPEEGVARVTHRVGCWESFGQEKDGTTFLLPEEALFLIELTRLELYFGETPVSVQQAYQLLLKKHLCTTDQYRVYAHLNRLGYRLLRRSPNIQKEKLSDRATPSSKRAKVEPPSLPFFTRMSHGAQNLPRTLFQPSAAESSDFDCIPNFSRENDAIQINFTDLNLLPETIRFNRQASYTIKKDAFPLTSRDEDDGQPGPSTSLKRTIPARNWCEYKAALSESRDDESDLARKILYQGKTKPLLDGCAVADMYSRLKIISVADEFDLMDEDEDANELKICYDLYSPGRKFRKAQPGTPCYCLAVTNWETPFPCPNSIARFQRDCGEQSIPLVAIAGKSADVAFYQLKDIVSPFSV